MVESIEVQNKESFVQDLDVVEESPLDDEQAAELWDIWNFRAENGADDYLIVLAPWLAQEELGIRRPFLFGEVEHDDESKGAILWSNLKMVNISIVENKVWGQVSVTETLEPVDITDSSDYIDDVGKMWMPRSQVTVFELKS